jgi:hypothetical protein
MLRDRVEDVIEVLEDIAKGHRARGDEFFY